MFNYIKMSLLSRLNEEKGQSMVEYGLIIGLVAVVVVAVLILLGPQIADMFQNIIDQLAGAGA